MERILQLFLVICLFSCESGDYTDLIEQQVEETQDEVEAIEDEVFDITDLPETAPGEVSILIGDELLNYSETEVRAQNLPQCGMPLLLQVNGSKTFSDGSQIVFNMYVVDAISGYFDVASLPWESCLLGSVRTSGVRLSMFYLNAAGEFQDIFLSDSELGSTGYIDIHEFEYVVQWTQMEDGFVSASFDVTLFKTYPEVDTSGTVRLLGTINNVPVLFPGCDSDFC